MQARVLLSLLWRSVLLFPLGLVIGFAVIGFPVQVIAICWWSTILFLEGSRMAGLIVISALIPVLVARRWMMSRVLGDSMLS
jgi:hypothetical protein